MELPDEGDKKDFEPDSSTVAFLDQQQEEFKSMEKEFFDTYGFKHNCHCGEDYSAGRVGEITQCYHNMMQEALATCARLNIELKEMTGIAQALLAELQQAGISKTQDVEQDGTGESLAAGEGDESVSAKSEPSDTEGVSVSSSGESEDSDAADDASGEGFGSTPIAPRETEHATEFFDKEHRDETDGKPEDSKLV